MIAARITPARLRRPRPTARLRLTLFYSGLFAVSAAILLAIPYLLIRSTSTGTITYNQANHSYTYVGPDGTMAAGKLTPPRPLGGRLTRFTSGQSRVVVEQMRTLAISQHDSELHQLLVYSVLALAVMAAVSVLLGR
jgi:hypothetical protein